MNKNINNIDININDYYDVCNKFNNSILSDELSMYIYNECRGKSFKDEFKINIKSKTKLSKEQKNKIVDMIRSNYGIDIKENMISIKYTNIGGIVLSILGVLLIILYNLLNKFNLSWISEVILIISWVMIWEAVYNFIFLETKKYIENKRYKKLTTCKIYFIDGDANEGN